MANITLRAAVLLNISSAVLCLLRVHCSWMIECYSENVPPEQWPEQLLYCKCTSNKSASMPTLMLRMPNYPSVALCEEV